MTCESKQSKDPFRGQIFTEVARYRGQCVAIKSIQTRSWDLNRTKRKELKIVSLQIVFAFPVIFYRWLKAKVTSAVTMTCIYECMCCVHI